MIWSGLSPTRITDGSAAGVSCSAGVVGVAAAASGISCAVVVMGIAVSNIRTARVMSFMVLPPFV